MRNQGGGTSEVRVRTNKTAQNLQKRLCEETPFGAPLAGSPCCPSRRRGLIGNRPGPRCKRPGPAVIVLEKAQTPPSKETTVGPKTRIKQIHVSTNANACMWAARDLIAGQVFRESMLLIGMRQHCFDYVFLVRQFSQRTNHVEKPNKSCG